MNLSKLFSTTLKMPGHININGNDYVGNNIEISGKRIIIDGDVVQELSGNVSLNITITGNCESVKTMSGDVVVKGIVHGDISTMSGDVRCGPIGGNVKTMSGDIVTR